jgi:hypothetical protein
MAVDQANKDSASDFEAHARNYAGFTQLLKWGAILSFVATMIILFIIAK